MSAPIWAKGGWRLIKTSNGYCSGINHRGRGIASWSDGRVSSCSNGGRFVQEILCEDDHARQLFIHVFVYSSSELFFFSSADPLDKGFG